MALSKQEFAAKTTIYAAKPRKTLNNKAQKYQTGSVPYFSATLTFTLFAAAKLEFESPTFYHDASLIHAIGKHPEFGGLVDGSTETQDGYSYRCIDYTKRLFGKASVSAKNKTSYSIITGLLKNRGIPTGGIKKTTRKHKKIVIKDMKVLDICHQLARLDNLEFFVNQDGIPVLRTPPATSKGYVFYAEKHAMDYSLDYEANEIITGVKVYGKDNKLLYAYNNSALIVKYGNIQDILREDNVTSSAAAKNVGQKHFKEKGKVQFKGSITIPQILNIRDGEKCVFVPPKGSGHKAKTYYTQAVKVDLAEETTTITFLDGKPLPPSEWIYTPPAETTNSSAGGDCTTSTSSSNVICATMKPSCGIGNYSYRNYDVCIINKCPKPPGGCGKEGTLVFRAPSTAPEGEWHCTACGADICLEGKIKETWSNDRVTITSGPTPSNNSIGARSVNSAKNKSCSVDGAPADLVTPSQIRKWVDDNILYSYYVGPKYSVQQVLQLNKGNCVDQSKLVVALCKAASIKAELVYLTVTGSCGGYTGGHANVHVWWQGRKYVIDTTCHALTSPGLP